MRGVRSAVLTLVGLGAVALAGGLAGARILSPATRRGIELVALTPVGLPLALIGAVAALGLLRRQRLLGGAVLVLALAVSTVHAWWLSPRFLGDVPDAADGPRLVVMAQNVEGGGTAAVVELAQERRVDVLVLTDASTEQLAELEESRLPGQFPHTTVDSGRGSLVWSRYPILEDVPLAEVGESRMVTLAVPSLDEVTLVAVHPTPPHVADGSSWQADWHQVIDRVEELRVDSAGTRVVVLGDLNATPDHWPLRTLAGWGFRDAAEQLNAGLAATWPANGRAARLGVTVPPLLSLDHVLTAPGLVVTDHAVSDAVGGDHRAVIATVAPAAP